ncbi:hypothetical protein [Burkholderia seminalis]|nr:hypothetical protein [Burkholderia seminalis]MDN7587730.1 hypothetical protein [Burkholderia seminalis]
MSDEDILYSEARGVATITISRPSVFDAFRARTVEDRHRNGRRAG